MYQRIIKKNIIDKIGRRKAIIIVGARQVGKTTLIKNLLKQNEYLFLDENI